MADDKRESEAGSCLTLNDDLNDARTALNDARRLLVAAKDLLCKRTKDGDETLEGAFKGATAAFNAAQSKFNAIAELDRDIKSVIHETLPIFYRKRVELDKGSATVASLTDEGFALVMARIGKIADPLERMDALWRIVALHRKAMKSCDEKLHKLGERNTYNRITDRQSEGTRADAARTGDLIQRVKDKRRIYELRLKDALGLFFATRMELVKSLAELTHTMAMVTPSDCEMARDASLRYDIVRDLEAIKCDEDRFRNPEGLIARTGRRARKRTHSMPSSLCCSAQIVV